MKKLLVFFLGITTLVLNASSDMRLLGEWTYKLDNRTVKLTGGQIVNRGSSTSGPLSLELYLTDTPFNGGTSISGYTIFSEERDPLATGFQYEFESELQPFDVPEGSYYVTLVLKEQDGFSNNVVAYLGFDGKATIKSKVDTDLQLAGNWSYKIDQNGVLLTGGQIRNTGSTTSAGLEFRLYFTEKPFEGIGRVGWYRYYPPLEAGSSIDVNETQTGLEIPPGTYYVTMELREGNVTSTISGKTTVVARKTFAEKAVVAGKASPAPAGNSSLILTNSAWNVSYLSFLVPPVHISGGTIINNRSSATGQLQLGLILTSDPYNGNNTNIFAVKVYEPLSALEKRDVELNLNVHTSMPAGTYYATLVLWEYEENAGNYVPVANIPLKDKITVQ